MLHLRPLPYQSSPQRRRPTSPYLSASPANTLPLTAVSLATRSATTALPLPSSNASVALRINNRLQVVTLPQPDRPPPRRLLDPSAVTSPADGSANTTAGKPLPASKHNPVTPSFLLPRLRSSSLIKIPSPLRRRPSLQLIPSSTIPKSPSYLDFRSRSDLRKP